MTVDKTKEQNLYKVCVLCEGLKPRGVGVKKAARIERRYATVLVQATDGNAAMEAAGKFVDANASPDIEWKAFTPLSASCFVLPIELEDFR